MAEFNHKEQLQPSLLDRLTDDKPGEKVESRDTRVLSMRRLKESVIRDLEWLLNSGNLDGVEDLSGFPEVRHSVLNYGVTDMAGKTLSRRDMEEVERMLRQAIMDFEPRILPKTLEVKAVLDDKAMGKHSLVFTISGELWSEPAPERLLLKTVLDLQLGSFELRKS